MDEAELYQKIKNGDYQTKIPHPSRNATKEKKDEYTKDCSKLRDQFKKDVIDAVGLKGHPKAEKAYFIAWDQWHSVGYFDVYCNLQDLAELLLD